MNINNKYFLYALIFFSAVFVDFFTKEWALRNLINTDYSIFSGINLSLVFNRGIAWGFFSSNSFLAFSLLTLVIFLIIFLLVCYMFSLFKMGEPIYFEVLILSGAVSNFIDRLLHQSVVDFIDLYIGSFHWATFNLADSFVVLGVFGILGRLLSNVYFSKTEAD